MPDDDSNLQELRRLASLAGFVPYATADTPWPSPRERSVASLNRRVHSRAARVRGAAGLIDPNGYMARSQAGVVDFIAGVDTWTLAWELVGDALCDADDVACQGLSQTTIEAALTALDRSAGAMRHVGKVYLAAWGDFHGEPLPHVVAPLANVALYSHRWFREIVRRRSAAETLSVVIASVGRFHWGVQNAAGSIIDSTFPAVTDWMRDVGDFVDAVLAVMVEVTVAAATTVRYE